MDNANSNALTRLNRAAKWLFLAAALWSIVASGWLFFAPTIQVTQTAVVEADGGTDDNQALSTSVERLSWFQSQGWTGIVVLLLFVGLYAGAASMIWWQYSWIGAGLSLFALLLTALARLSVGPLYFPSAAAVIVALVLLTAASLASNNG